MVLSGSPVTYVEAVDRAVDIDDCLLEAQAPVQPLVLGNRGGSGSRLPARQRKNKNCRETINTIKTINKSMTFIGRLDHYLAGNSCLAPTSFSRKPALHGRWRIFRRHKAAAAAAAAVYERREGAAAKLSDGFGSGPTGPGPTDEHSVHPHHRDFIVNPIADQIGPINSVSKTEHYNLRNHFSEPQCKMTVSPLNSGIQLAVGPKPLRLRNHNFGLAHRIMGSQQLKCQRFKPRGKQFKKKAHSSSSGSVSSGGSNSGSMFCGQCGGKHETLQCRGVRGLCHICGQPGNFARACPLMVGQPLGQSQQGSAGGSSQRHQPFVQSQRSGFQPHESSRFGVPSRPPFPEPQQAQANALTREQAYEIPTGVIQGTCFIFDFPARVLIDTGASHSFISEFLVYERGLSSSPLCDVVSVSTPAGVSLLSREVVVDCSTLGKK
ncbi:hypothetical protein F511_14717 [Dorcoceras hygrometricum]|uniref:CCHC-type domain-containing protein n=1 Tax=Dorcoceras hygrometricum TaxID=472368 RepID=A0A2Z7A580_9LAMI|nr:hypothetical protein F511_14717 [Dorcoceras hygrometricum]